MGTPDSRTPTLGQAIDDLITSRLDMVHTCLPGRIQSYDAAKQLAEVEVTVKKLVHTMEGDTLVESFPILPNVRIEFPQTANFFMSFPLAQGDFVWVHFAEQSIDKWLQNGGAGQEDPIDRRFDLTDSWAVPARNPKANIAETSGSAVVIGAKGGANARAYFKQNEIALGEENPASYVGLAQKIDQAISNIVTNLNANYGLIATGVAAGGGAYTPTVLGAQASTAATVVKAK